MLWTGSLDERADDVAATDLQADGDDFQAERLIAYELGYRWQPARSWSFDLALFYNDYDRLASLEIGTPFVDTDGRTVIPIVNENLTSGSTSGAELQVDWSPLDNWRLSVDYSHIEVSLTASGADLNNGVLLEGSTPRNLAGLRSLLTLGKDVEIDAQYRYQSRIRTLPQVFPVDGIDAYSELDLRIGWRVTDQWDLSLVGQNLLHDEHAEFGTAATRGNFERAAYVQATWRD